MSVNLCAWSPLMDYDSIKDVFPTHASFSRDILQIHHDTSQDKALKKKKIYVLSILWFVGSTDFL